MTILIPLIIILIAEYIGDFLLQSRETALGKSKDTKYLFKHLFQIALVLGLCFDVMLLFGFAASFLSMLGFIVFYCLIHGIQDWYIWKGYKWSVYKRVHKNVYSEETRIDDANKKYRESQLESALASFEINREYAEDKVFYDTIGLDRLLHVITLIILYGILLL